MTDHNVNGCRYFVKEAGPKDGDVVALGHGYMMTHEMFEAQVAELSKRYRCIVWDWRGQGRSEVTEGGYNPWDLADDAAALLERLDVRRCHYVGFSMGGYAGMRLALRRPDLIHSLSFVDTGSESATRVQRVRYEVLLGALSMVGFRPLLPMVRAIVFGQPFLNDPNRKHEVAKWSEVIASNDRVGLVRAGKGIFRRDSVTRRLGEITVPTQFIAGKDDKPHPVADHERDAGLIDGAKVTVIPRAGHTAPVEEPELVTQALAAFLEAHPMNAEGAG